MRQLTHKPCDDAYQNQPFEQIKTSCFLLEMFGTNVLTDLTG